MYTLIQNTILLSDSWLSEPFHNQFQLQFTCNFKFNFIDVAISKCSMFNVLRRSVFGSVLCSAFFVCYSSSLHSGHAFIHSFIYLFRYYFLSELWAYERFVRIYFICIFSAFYVLYIIFQLLFMEVIIV